MRQVVEVEEVVCDVCGEEADGEYFSMGRLNGEICFEGYCPIDLCQEHMRIWFRHCSDTEFERYDGPPSDEEKKEVVERLKRHICE